MHENHLANNSHTTASSSAFATLHCLTGCVIGEVMGLMLGVTYQLSLWNTVIIATVLAYLVGFSLAILPLMRKEAISLFSAFKVIWIGETVSIAIMEMTMNLVDYWIGGIEANSILAPIFWIGLGAAIPAGFIAAWPVNYWLLKRALKTCH